jgi:hypothetical protein
MAKQKPTLSLIDLIVEIGDDRAAEMFHVKHRTVASWRRSERWPLARDIPHLIEMSGGRLSLESFFCRDRTDAA